MDGKTLFEARTILGLSIIEAAARLSVARQTYSRYENGDPIPKPKLEMARKFVLDAEEKENKIDKILNSSDPQTIFTEFVEELKGMRKDYRELKVLLMDFMDKSSTESKINQISDSQLGLLHKTVESIVQELEENKKADSKKSASRK